MQPAAQKTYLVTGATSGIGEATATRLAGDGHRVLLGARTREHAEEAISHIRARVRNADLDTLVADLAEMKQVGEMSAQVSERTDRLDGLILNAAVSRPRHELTDEGVEVNFAANYLSGFLLTSLLMPLLKAADQGRIVALSSAFHAHVTSLDISALATGTGIEPSKRYETTKLLTVLFARELARRLESTRVTANVADPGFVRTRLGRYTTGAFRLMLRLTRPMQVPPEKAAETVVYLATSPEVATTSGRYFAGSAKTEPSSLSQDPELARALWDYSVRLLTERGMLTPGDVP